MIKGYADQKKSNDGRPDFATIAPVREQQFGLDVIAHIFHQTIASDAAEAGSTTRIIKATGHAALVGDLISWTSGALDTREYRVAEIPDANHITICEDMATAPSAADTFDLMRPKAPRVSDDGELTVGVTFANDTNYGAVGANTLRTAAQIGNATGPVAFDSGASSAQTIRMVLATRHEAASTPLSTRLSDGSAFLGSDYGLASAALRVAAQLGNASGIAAFGSGAVSAQVLRTTPASDSPHLLATRHEAVATPLAFQQSNGTAAVAFDSGASGSTTPRAVLATRHEAVTTPLAAQLSNGSAAAAYGAGVVGSTVLRVAHASDSPVGTSLIAYQVKGKIAGTALTGSYATLVNPTADLKLIVVLNSCDQTIFVSLDGGTTDTLELEAGESVILDLAVNGLRFDNTVNISAKHGGVVPTAGTVRVTGVG